MYLEYFCEYKIHARAFTFIYLSSNVCSTRNDRSIDRLASGPQIKRSFLRAMFASQTIWRLPTIFLFTVILICALSFNGSCKMRAVFTGEPRKTNYFAINLFLQTRSLDATREVFTSEFTCECEQFIESPRSKYNTWVHREIIIFIVRLFIYNTQRNLCLLINDATWHVVVIDYWSFFIISRILSCSAIVF